MAIGIYDLDDDDDIIESPQNGEEGSQELDLGNAVREAFGATPASDDFMSDFLRSKGIDDPNNIQFEEEDGSIITRSWNDLTREEQMNIANTSFSTEQEDSFEGFDDEELELINQIRQSGMTPTQYLQSIQGDQVIQEPVYKIDDLSDDEIFLLDLESRVGELTEDEGVAALNAAKQNEEFYKKQVDGIRKEYKEREDFQSQQEQAAVEQEQQEAYDRYQAVVVDSINQFNSVGNLDLNLEDSDKEELAEFMLSQDENGLNYFYQALQDPETLVKAAWFILNGEEAFDSISDYFKTQIKLAGESQYKKGFEDGRNGVSTRPQVVIDNSKRTNQHRVYKTIEDLDDED